MKRNSSAPSVRFGRLRSALLLMLLPLAACSIIAPPPPITPSPLASGEDSPSARADVTLTVAPPSEVPAGTQVVLVLLDEVTGLPLHPEESPMKQLPDGRWQAVVSGPLNSVLHYRYALRGTVNADEITAAGDSLRDRTLWLASTIAIDDRIAAWAGGSYAGPTGRIVGTVIDADSRQPIQEVLVSASGVSMFTNGQGEFRLDGLAPGLHTLTAMSPAGSTVPFQQGALVAADSATPALLPLNRAASVQVTFEVEIPADSAGGMPLRMAGNLRQLGARFSDMPGQAGGAVERMPTLVPVDASHFIFITELFSGTDLEYKYTLGDGLWNAERDPEGFLRTRQLIVPEADTVIHDVVDTWTTPGRGALIVDVRVPSATTGDAPIALQFMPSEEFQPLPMWPSAEDTWSYKVYSPPDSQGALAYRYCRMADCWRVNPGGSGEALAEPRLLAQAADPIAVKDTVASWVWPSGSVSSGQVVAPQIEPRPGFEAGVELQPDPDPNAVGFVEGALREIAQGGANAVTLAPGWTLGRSSSSPVMGLNPGEAPFAGEIIDEMSEAQGQGLQVSLRPTLFASGGDLAGWWAASVRDAAWWDAWFENYQAFALTYAWVAAEGGADKIILGGPEAAPAFPGGTLEDGSLAGAPQDSENRWREIIASVRSVFRGTIALELELGEGLQSPPPFVDAVDQIHIYWHPSLNGDQGGSMDELRAEAARWMDESLLAEPLLADKPLILSVEYPSVSGGDSGCIRKPDGGCTPTSELAMGAMLDSSLVLDLDSQARAYNAVLLEAYERTQIRGIYARGFNSALALQDLSASVRGKPAQDVLWYWYSRLTGKGAP